MALLYDMLQYACARGPIIAGVTNEQYLRRVATRLAVERAIEVIGEAARHVSREFQSAHPEVPWRKIIAMRHVLAHGYGELDHEAIWRVATVHVPELVELIGPMIPPLESDGAPSSGPADA